MDSIAVSSTTGFQQAVDQSRVESSTNKLYEVSDYSFKVILRWFVREILSLEIQDENKELRKEWKAWLKDLDDTVNTICFSCPPNLDLNQYSKKDYQQSILFLDPKFKLGCFVYTLYRVLIGRGKFNVDRFSSVDWIYGYTRY